MEIMVKIEAPELVGALNTLAAALETKNLELTTAAIATNLTPAPVQPMVQPTAPAIAPVAPVSEPVTNPVNPTPAPVQPMVQPTAPVAQAVPTAAPSYTMEQLAVAATQLVDAGQRDSLVALLQQFGAQSLTALPKEQYGNFANALRQMGAKL